MTSQIKVETDVVIPTIGRPSLSRAVRSVVDQTSPSHPIIVLDRPENYLQVKSALADYPHTLLVTEGGSRSANARNLGIENATNPVVGFLDDDDWWGPRRIQHMLGKVSNYSDRFLAASAFVFQLPSGDTRIVPSTAPPFANLGNENAETLSDYLVSRRQLRFGNNAMQTSAMLMSLSVAREFRWDSDLAKHQDWDFILRIAADPSVGFVWTDNADCYVTKDSPNSISRNMDWVASSKWLDRHENALGSRARADFMYVHMLRAALANRSRNGIISFLQRRPGIPHVAAAVVGLEGFRASLGKKK